MRLPGLCGKISEQNVGESFSGAGWPDQSGTGEALTGCGRSARNMNSGKKKYFKPMIYSIEPGTAEHDRVKALLEMDASKSSADV